MAIVRLQHVGTAVSDHARTVARLAELGLPTRDFRDDQGKGFQHDSRALLGNDCWLHVVQNWNPESRVNRFLAARGEALEHVALESDDIEADVARLRGLGIPIFEDHVFDANDGFEAFVFPDDAVGFTVELIQPHAHSWGYPVEAKDGPVSDLLGRVRLAEVHARVEDVERATERFATIFGLGPESPGRIPLGNAELVLDAPDGHATGLAGLVLETERAPDPPEPYPFGIRLRTR